MARTKATVGAKIFSGKSSKARCSAPPSTNTTPRASGNNERSSRNYSGGNPVCPRETPKWQKPITNFFTMKDSKDSSDSDEHSGKENNKETKQKPNVIHSDVEDEETPTNHVLDETIELEPLTGEDSHKIVEYYPTETAKGKGVGKSSKTNGKAEVRRSSKRDYEEIAVEEHSASKRVKVI